MAETVISVENLSKSYRLGQIGTGTLTNDLKVWWARKRGLPNPLLKIGQTDHGNRDGEELWALRDVSFTVQQGEVLGIIGRNGAGKSTLLKILSRVTAPTGGCVKVRGRIASLLEVGTGFHPELTGRENISLNGAILGMSRDEVRRKFDEIVAFAEVEKFIDTPVKRYSSGMYVRLAFAVAAHLESEILLVDEVLAVGDAEFQKKCLGKMGDVASQEGRTVLFVSHNMAAVQKLCQRVVTLKSGRINQISLAENAVYEYLKTITDPSEKHMFANEIKSDFKIQQWWILDQQLGKSNKIRSGEPFQLIVEYSDDSNQVKSNVAIDFTIKNSMDIPLLTSSNIFSGQLFPTIPIQGQLVCNFSGMPLIPGVYRVKFWIASNQEVLVKIEDAGVLEVIQTDIFGNGKLPREKKHGVIVTHFDWGVKPNIE